MRPWSASILTLLIVALFAVLTQCVSVTYSSGPSRSSVTFSLLWNGWVLVVLVTISLMVYVTMQGMRPPVWDPPALPKPPK